MRHNLRGILDKLDLNENQELFSQLCEVLEKCPIFKGSDALRIARSGELTAFSYKSGEVIYGRQDFERALGIIIKGYVTVYKDTECKNVILRELREGDTFGAAALFGGECYASVLKAKKSAVIAFIPQVMMRRLMEEDFEVAERYISFLSDKIRFLNAKLDLHTAPSACEKLLSYLSTVKKAEKVNIQHLSKELDMGRATLYRAIEKLEKEGLIERLEKEIVLKKEE